MQQSRLRRLGAVLAGAAILVAACSDDKKSDSTDTTAPGTTAASSTSAGGDTGVTCDGVKLAFMGALSGDNGALGTNMINGAQIAIDEFNAANPNCQVEFDTSYDSQGSPDQATPLADQIVNDAAIIGLIGPGFSGETKATMPKFEEAGLPMITPGATNALLSTNGWTMFHRILANDDKQAPGVVKLITETIGATKVGVIDDASEYGKGLADSVRSGLGDLDVADAQIDPAAADYSAAIEAMKTAGVDTVFYGGYYAEAAKLVQQMRDAGLEATFVSGDGSLDKAFVENAGPSAEGAYLTATGAPSDVNPEFQAAFNEKFGSDPALYSPEAYDCAKVFLAGIAAGNTTRESLAAFVSAYDAPGITKQIKFDATGEPEGDAVYYYVVESGVIVAKGLI
ncbi:MAG TPA: branched-chain amino acid ABC transporter substrate-binding protein [Ilumatobacteraceae bacterium]|nr:branched-chain amino acid ABC transporter substrate-binding protein [Ilumatobacteraceae bacterium]